MPVTSLDLLKTHCAIDHDLDDALLTHKLAAAEEWIGNHIGYSFDGYDPFPPPPLLTEAALQLASYWYAQREAASFGVTTVPVPFGVHRMLESHRWQVTGHG